MVWTPALGFGVGFRHIGPSLGRAVVLTAIAVIDIARGIQPDQTRTTASRHGPGSLRGGARRGRCGRRRSRSSRRRRSRLGRRRSSGRGRCRRCRSSRRIPLLHSLMPSTSTLFAGCRRVSPIFTLSCRSGWRLGRSHLYGKKTRRNCHPTNRCLHKLPQLDLDIYESPVRSPREVRSWQKPTPYRQPLSFLARQALHHANAAAPITQMSHPLLPLRDSCG